MDPFLIRDGRTSDLEAGCAPRGPGHLSSSAQNRRRELIWEPLPIVAATAITARSRGREFRSDLTLTAKVHTRGPPAARPLANRDYDRRRPSAQARIAGRRSSLRKWAWWRDSGHYGALGEFRGLDCQGEVRSDTRGKPPPLIAVGSTCGDVASRHEPRRSSRGRSRKTPG
jgi:hypothetical protein